MSSSEEELVRALSPVCSALEVRLEDVEIGKGTLKVTVERAGGIDLGALAEVTRSISSFLDDHEGLAPGARYELEVSTPGVERRLRNRDQFTRAVGKTVALRLRAGAEGSRRLEGTLSGADAEGFEVVLEGGVSRRLAYGDVDRAHTVFDWRRAFAEEKHERGAADGRGTKDETRKKVARP